MALAISDKIIKLKSCQSLNLENPDSVAGVINSYVVTQAKAISDKILYFVKTRCSHIKISVIEGIKYIYIKNNVLIKYIHHLRSSQSLLYDMRFI